MKTDELREAFLDFFVSKGCERRPSDVLVPNDPTVLFTPAGMNQFKREFMGQGDPKFKRAATCQKCIRTGDIENVGKTPRHMTFFEMLGNFSFGDYFKREAIHWAWELLTQVLKVPRERLTVTVYLDDDEAYSIWRDEVKVPADRITRLGEDDNFWPAGSPTNGPNGVCGPCSEIFFHGEGIEAVEIWNLVFTQFNRVGVNKLEPLPKKNIDTGMGLERMAAALQGARSNFEVDIFRPIVAASADALEVDYAKVAETPDGIRVRRAADHARALTFTIHENVRPSNEKQGYVVRRLLRRAVLDGYLMGRREPFLHEIVPAVADAMKEAYPELAESVPRVRTTIKEEEEKFFRNLENGVKLLNDTFRKTKASGTDTIEGAAVFDLLSTYGIPVEVTEGLAAEQNLRIDREGLEKAREAFAKISRGTTEAADVFATGPLDTLREVYHDGSGFVGYETTSSPAKLIGIVEQGKLAESAVVSEKPPIALVLDRTPFYGEAGGQVGDTGAIQGEGWTFRVEDTKKDHDFTLHIGRVVEGTAHINDDVRAEVDPERRQAIRRAHSATHVLHHALHQLLGRHAQQAGSKVEPDRLRFDFANPQGVPRETLRAIEATVNERVLKGDSISWAVMPIAEARKLGAMALFGEKYPENARVVSMGTFSRELCGGTHLDNLGQVGLFKIIGEESVAAGTRRVTALTGQAALDYVRQEEDALGEVAAALKVAPGQAASRVTALLEELKALKKQATQKKAEGPKVSADEILAAASSVGADLKVVAHKVENASIEELRQLVLVLMKKMGTNLAVLVGSEADGKVNLIAGMTADLVKKGLHAGQWLKEIAPIVGGGGGGKADLAQAGGKDPSRLPEAMSKAVDVMKGMAGG
jgi:alanyl-tRNA synthetase